MYKYITHPTHWVNETFSKGLNLWLIYYCLHQNTIDVNNNKVIISAYLTIIGNSKVLQYSIQNFIFNHLLNSKVSSNLLFYFIVVNIIPFFLFNTLKKSLNLIINYLWCHKDYELI